jgi:hypothetical protein
MDVFLVPLGRDRYELYSEQPVELDADAGAPSPGIVGRALQRFSALLRAAEAREHDREANGSEKAKGWLARVQDRFLAWVVERVAEQRLLWNLRGKTTAVVLHPQDMTFDQVMTLVRTGLQRDYERHRMWLAIDFLGMLGAALLTPIPGPNVLGFYFTFRVGGHFLSMRGAAPGDVAKPLGAAGQRGSYPGHRQPLAPAAPVDLLRAHDGPPRVIKGSPIRYHPQQAFERDDRAATMERPAFTNRANTPLC